jgi:predicted dehydrogenase
MAYGISLFGERGTISIGGMFLDQIIRWTFADGPFQSEAAQAMVTQQNEHQLMYQDLIDAIRSGNRQVLIDAREGKRPFEIICALYQSSLLNLPVTLPLRSFSTTNMRGKKG